MYLRDISLNDLEFCVSVSKMGSLREAARFHGVDPGHGSKMIARVEKSMGEVLFKRSQYGMRLTSFGSQVIAYMERVVESSFSMQNAFVGNTDHIPLITIGSLSFLNQELLVRVMEGLAELDGTSRIRLVDLPPSQIVTTGLAGAFDIAVHVGRLEWTSSWVSKTFGRLSWCLIARRGHPLRVNATERDVLKFPFVIPTYWEPTGFQMGNDQCPVPIANRIKGHETSTAVTAVNTVEQTDNVAFVPEIMARNRIRNKTIKIISVREWEDYSVPLYLSVRSGVVKKKWLQNALELLSSVVSPTSGSD